MPDEHVLNPGFVHLLFAVSWLLIYKNIWPKNRVVEIVDLVIVLFLGNLPKSSDRCLVDDVQGSIRDEAALGVPSVVMENLGPDVD